MFERFEVPNLGGRFEFPRPLRPPGPPTPQNQRNAPAIEENNVGPERLGQALENGAPTPTATAQGEARSRPVFKMRRTGHSGPFPFSGRPVASSHSPAASDASHGSAAPAVTSVPPQFSSSASGTTEPPRETTTPAATDSPATVADESSSPFPTSAPTTVMVGCPPRRPL